LMYPKTATLRGRRAALRHDAQLSGGRPTTLSPGICDRKTVNVGHGAMVGHKIRLLHAAGLVRQTALAG